MDSSYWQAGYGLLNNLAMSGAFGSDGKKIAGYVNPPSQLAQPNPAPPPPPVAGQQGVNPAATSGGFGAHMSRHWGKYTIAAGAVVALIVGVKLLRKG